MGNPQLKKICLITPGHLATNPRLVKEASALLEAGYQVHVIFTQYMDYLLVDDEKILNTYTNLTYDKLNWTRNNALRRIYSGAVQKICKWLSRLLPKNNLIHKLILNRNYFWQYRKAVSAKASMYISHNLGALPVAADAAKKNRAKCGFDAEDFHRNEVSNVPNDFQVKLKTFIDDKYLKEVDYLTCASPLISKAYKTLYLQLYPIVINNVFELKHQSQIKLNQNKGLKLFWFSQTIGKNRGLEEVILALNLIDNPLIELHLLGYLDQNENGYFNNLANFSINYHQPISNSDIFKLASQFDIGLALERKQPLNRDICLTNKIFTYLISGLAIIASNTQAQQLFLKENEAIGKVYPIGNTTELSKIIVELLNNKDLLNTYKANAYKLAQTKYNWEMESKQFIDIVEKTLNN
ncbi:glycosyltransferase family protein [Pedobacter agri]|uniref:Spore protein YkvP/CgeB glycosyl transferase-like domain-containing protein n=1 Tax=Pedobacter agri TaxID=454586 RepID=A0A9X3D9U7_9SPHI|nr:hypothetical protein [Pedobacter agri]MCX3263648.1 hypothetical protein [Pedobacter agri]